MVRNAYAFQQVKDLAILVRYDSPHFEYAPGHVHPS
jgi:hypothetical protein